MIAVLFIFGKTLTNTSSMAMTSRPMMTPHVTDWVEHCPAKINLRLSVLGRRVDGYHDLRSIVAQIGLEDHLEIHWSDQWTEDEFECSVEGLTENPTENLVMRALKAFRGQYPFSGGVRVYLDKKIPVGAGLGGGSSDAAGMLRGLQVMWGNPLGGDVIGALATQLGADVPLFLNEGFSLMSGIGDVLEPAEGIRDWVKAYRIAVIKPWWSVNTAWAYRSMAEMKAYSPEERLEDIEKLRKKGDLSGFLKNDFRQVVDARYPTNTLLYAGLNARATVFAEMSGSGSAGFALFESESDWDFIRREVMYCWGAKAQCEEVAFI